MDSYNIQYVRTERVMLYIANFDETGEFLTPVWTSVHSL